MRRSLFGAVGGDGYPFVVNGAWDTQAIHDAAQFDDVCLDAAFMLKKPELVQLIRDAAGRKIRVIGYICHGNLWDNGSGDLDAERYEIAQKNDAWLYKTMGRTNQLNMAHTAAQIQTAELIANRILSSHVIDDIFLDVTPPTVSNVVASGFDIARMGFSDGGAYEAAWKAGHAAFILRLCELTDAFNKPTASRVKLIGNTGPAGEPGMWMGWMREGFPRQNGNPAFPPSWYTNMVGYTQPWGEKIPGVMKESYLDPRLSVIMMSPAIGGPLTAGNRQRLRFGMGSAYLAGDVYGVSKVAATFSWYRGEWNKAWVRDHMRWWTTPEYEVELGEPQENVVELSGSKLWVRRFNSGIVIVNPTQASVLWKGTVNYIDADGIKQRNWSVAPNDALILRR